MKTITIALAITVLLLSACSSTPQASSNVRPAQATAEMATVFVLWPVTGMNVQTAGVYVDGTQRALLRRNRYARLDIPPGDHEIKLRFVGILGVSMPATKRVFRFRPTESHYIVFSYDFDMNGLLLVGGTPIVTGTTTHDVVEVEPKQGKLLMERLVPGVLK